MAALVIDGQEVIVKTYASGRLFVARYVPEQRRVNGTLVRPPAVFAIHYDPELDRLETEWISWGTAISLATADLAVIGDAIHADRMREADEPKAGGLTWIAR